MQRKSDQVIIADGAECTWNYPRWLQVFGIMETIFQVLRSKVMDINFF